jgi:hypothetical protein
MTTEIRDASLEARIRKQLQATGSSSVEEVLLRLEPTFCARELLFYINRFLTWRMDPQSSENFLRL